MVYNRIQVAFGALRKINGPPLQWQYNEKQILVISGLDLPEFYSVDFMNKGDADTITMPKTDNGIEIPDQFLLTGKPLIAYIVVVDGESVNTIGQITFPVNVRGRRTDISPEPVEQQQIDSLIDTLNSGVTRAETAAEAAEQAETEIEAYVERAAQSASSASASASAAAGSASSAASSANSASTSAGQAASSASSAGTSASQAAGSAQSASGSATSASQSATNAANSETTAATKAGEAASSATAARNAQSAAETAQGKAEDAQEAAEAAAESVSSSAAQIETNRQNIESLAASVGTIENAGGMASGIAVGATPGEAVRILDAIPSRPFDKIRIDVEPVQLGSGDPSRDNVRPFEFQTLYNLNVWNTFNWIHPTNGNRLESNGIVLEYLGFGLFHCYGTSTAKVDMSFQTYPYFLYGAVWLNNTAIQSMQLLFNRSNWTLNAVNRKCSSGLLSGTFSSFGVLINAGVTVDVYFQPIGTGSFVDNYKHAYNIELPFSTMSKGALTISNDSSMSQIIDYDLYTFTGNENFGEYTQWDTEDELCFGMTGKDLWQPDTTSVLVQCTHFKGVSRSYIGSAGNRHGDLISVWNGPGDNGHFVFFVPKSDFSSVDDFKAYLRDQYEAGTPVQTLYLVHERTVTVPCEQIMTATSGTNYVFIANMATKGSLQNPKEIAELRYYKDLEEYIAEKIDEPKSMIAGVEPTGKASKNYTVGNLLIVGNTLYKVTANIARNATIEEGVNVVETTVAEQLILLANA